MAAFLATLLLTACKETDDEVEEFPNWEQRNEQFFTNKYNMVKQQVGAGSKTWKIFKSYSKAPDAPEVPTDYILVHVLEEGTGSGCPLYTDTVRCHYRGQLLASTSYVDAADNELGIVFDKSWTTETYQPALSVPAKFSVSATVDGFSTALQHMHIGDHWLVYIPYQLGYGTSDRTGIPGYSTLVFDLSLAAYYRPGTKVPDWQASESYLWDVE